MVKSFINTTSKGKSHLIFQRLICPSALSTIDRSVCPLSSFTSPPPAVRHRSVQTIIIQGVNAEKAERLLHDAKTTHE